MSTNLRVAPRRPKENFTVIDGDLRREVQGLASGTIALRERGEGPLPDMLLYKNAVKERMALLQAGQFIDRQAELLVHAEDEARACELRRHMYAFADKVWDLATRAVRHADARRALAGRTEPGGAA